MKFLLMPLLWFLSLVYFLAIELKFFFYSSGFLKKKKLPIKVICVGNISLGGTGKTSVVIYLAKMLLEKGHKVSVLSRGYGRKVRGPKSKVQCPCVVSDGERILVTPEEVGDEPHLLARKLKSVPVIIGKDRYRSGLLAKEKFSSETVLLDDGFQRWSLERDLDIVCLDSLVPLDKEPIFPLGTLREPPSALKRAGLILLNHVNLISEKELNWWYWYLKKVCPQVPIVEGIYQPLRLHQLSNESPLIGIEFLKNKEVILFSTIANPYAFKKIVEHLNVKVIKHYFFPDHYCYKERDLLPLREGHHLMLTTEKDEVKLKKFISSELSISFEKTYILEVELQIVRGKDIWEEKIKQFCG